MCGEIILENNKRLKLHLFGGFFRRQDSAIFSESDSGWLGDSANSALSGEFLVSKVFVVSWWYIISMDADHQPNRTVT
jgi:hypothetical protein